MKFVWKPSQCSAYQILLFCSGVFSHWERNVSAIRLSLRSLLQMMRHVLANGLVCLLLGVSCAKATDRVAIAIAIRKEKYGAFKLRPTARVVP